MKVINELEKQAIQQKLPNFNVGDTVEVHLKFMEADKERLQVFTGIVIARKGSSLRETFTVRRIIQGEGVERVFPVHSPLITRIVVKKKGQPRRAKLYYLRKRTGKSVKVKEKLSIVPGEEMTPESTSSDKKPPATKDPAVKPNK